MGLCTGCAGHGGLVLEQSFAPPTQRELRLTPMGAGWAETDGTVRAMLTFPLPGSVAGPRAFVAYLVLPGSVGQFAVTPQAAGTAHGFMIQEVGQLAGRCDFVEGTCRLEPAGWRGSARRLELDVVGRDGALLRGTILLTQQPREVAAFEREFAADVASLGSAPGSRAATGPQ